MTNVNTSALQLGSGVAFQSNCYDSCPPLQSIINKKAQAITRGKLIPIDDKGTLKVSAGFNEAMKVLNNPNKYQTKDQFLRTIETFINVYGNCYVYKVIPIGFSKIIGLIIIPNNCVTVTLNKPSNVLSNNAELVRTYSISIYGMNFLLSGENTKLIYEIQDVTCNLTNNHEFEAKSRIDALRQPIVNIVGSLESRNTLITRRGAEVILSPSGNDVAGTQITLNNKEIERLQFEYTKYGMLANQYHTLIPKIPMTVTKIGMNARELAYFDGENADHRAIAQGYGVPVPLLGLPDTTKFNTYLEAKREFYEDTIIPESNVICQAFDVLFDSVKNGYRFKFDYSELECMQKSQKENAETFNIMVNALSKAKTDGLINEAEATNILNRYK
jgi:phage portal protein BeeE